MQVIELACKYVIQNDLPVGISLFFEGETIEHDFYHAVAPHQDKDDNYYVYRRPRDNEYPMVRVTLDPEWELRLLLKKVRLDTQVQLWGNQTDLEKLLEKEKERLEKEQKATQSAVTDKLKKLKERLENEAETTQSAVTDKLKEVKDLLESAQPSALDAHNLAVKLQAEGKEDGADELQKDTQLLLQKLAALEALEAVPEIISRIEKISFRKSKKFLFRDNNGEYEALQVASKYDSNDREPSLYPFQAVMTQAMPLYTRTKVDGSTDSQILLKFEKLETSNVRVQNRSKHNIGVWSGLAKLNHATTAHDYHWSEEDFDKNKYDWKDPRYIDYNEPEKQTPPNQVPKQRGHTQILRAGINSSVPIVNLNEVQNDQQPQKTNKEQKGKNISGAEEPAYHWSLILKAVTLDDPAAVDAAAAAAESAEPDVSHTDSHRSYKWDEKTESRCAKLCPQQWNSDIAEQEGVSNFDCWEMSYNFDPSTKEGKFIDCILIFKNNKHETMSDVTAVINIHVRKRGPQRIVVLTDSEYLPRTEQESDLTPEQWMKEYRDKNGQILHDRKKRKEEAGTSLTPLAQFSTGISDWGSSIFNLGSSSSSEAAHEERLHKQNVLNPLQSIFRANIAGICVAAFNDNTTCAADAENFRLTISGVEYLQRTRENDIKEIVSIDALQLDNQNAGTAKFNKVISALAHRDAPFFFFKWTEEVSDEDKIKNSVDGKAKEDFKVYNSVVLAIEPLCVQLEQEFLYSVFNWKERLNNTCQIEDQDTVEPTAEDSQEPKDAQAAKPAPKQKNRTFFIEDFQMGPAVMQLTMQDNPSETISAEDRAAIAILGYVPNVRDHQICLPPMFYEMAKAKALGAIVADLVGKYKVPIALEGMAIAGSLEVLGNPTRLIKNISGANDQQVQEWAAKTYFDEATGGNTVITITGGAGSAELIRAFGEMALFGSTIMRPLTRYIATIVSRTLVCTLVLGSGQ